MAAGDKDVREGGFALSPRLRGDTLAWFAVSALTLADIFAYVDRTIITLLIEPIKVDLVLSDTEVALVQGLAFGLFFALAGLPLGWLADRGSRRRLLLITSALWCAMTASCGLARNFWSLFASRMGVGIGEAALSPAAISLIGDYFPKERRGAAIAVYSLAGAGGGGVSLIVGGALVGAVTRNGSFHLPMLGTVAPWQAAFLVLGIGSLPILLLLAAIREPARQSEKDAQQPRSELRRIFPHDNSFALRHYASLAAFGLLAHGMMAWLPTLFIRTHGWSAADTGARLGLVLLLTGSIGPLAGAWLEKRIARWTKGAPVIVTGGGMALAGVALAVSALLANPWLALAGLGIGMFFTAATTVTAIEAIQEAVPANVRAQAAALLFISINVFGALLGPLSVAMLSDRLFGEAHLDLAISTVALVSGGLAGLLSLSARRSFVTLSPTA